MTVSCTDQRYIWPARHQAGCERPARRWGPVPLKARIPVGGFSAERAGVLLAFKRYGMIVADNGSTGLPGHGRRRVDNGPSTS